MRRTQRIGASGGAGRLAVSAAALAVGCVLGVAAPAAQDSNETSAEFTQAYLEDPANIEEGGKIWQEQCRHCHGSAAYPGKAPKLKPGRYEPAFVYNRVTNGFGDMPSWKEYYSKQQRKAVVAYVLSDQFAP